MSGEIVVSETPNWLQSLEDKREQRLKARLGHEAGAGAPCLKCGDKCPGLDLHFWRKACKICRCPKEEHDVHDDDIYGWAQFQLLGSKPNKIKTKIVLPGKKDEVELEWAPKGQKETIDKYLKTLPPEALPVKGSQAAQERKQMLQKQIPIHDIDPSLCHELNEEEVAKMEEYIAHIKKSSVGVGQIVNLSSVIKANLHNISPQEAHIIASRYSKGIPFSEIVKLQSGLAKNLEKLTINDPNTPKNKAMLPNLQPTRLGGNISEQDMQNPLIAAKYKDITHPWYTDSGPNKGLSQSQYAQGFKSGQSGGLPTNHPDYQAPNYSIDQKLLEGTNFDPSKTPSQFLGYHTPGYRPVQPEGPQFQGEYENSMVIPYEKVSSRPQGNDAAFSSDVEKSKALNSGDLGGQKEGTPYNAQVLRSYRPGDIENIEGFHGKGPNYAQNLHGDHKLPPSEQYGFENPYFNQSLPGKAPKHNTNTVGAVLPSKTILGKVPGYSPNIYDPQVDIQDPKAPKSVKDLMYSTYDPSKGPLPEDTEIGAKNKTNRPSDSGYNPNVTFNTYKHDPSVIRYENPPLLGQNEPAQPLAGKKTTFGPGILKNKAQGYIDPKTGNYVPEPDRLGPGYPDYNTTNPQNPYGSFDPKTGKYISGDVYYPEDGNDDIRNSGHGPGHSNYDPKNPQHENFGPGHPNYDPANPQGFGYFDPKTGQYISNNPENDNHFAPGHPNYDPNISYVPGYVDPITGKYIVGDDGDRKTAPFDPRNPNAPYDPSTPGNFDPKTGKYLPDQGTQSFHPSNPRFGSFDPNTSSLGSNRPQNIPGLDNYDRNNPDLGQHPESTLGDSNASLGRPRKPLAQLQPGQLNIFEDYLEPHMVNVGSIQDINPDIKAATTERNPGFDNESVYSDNGAEYSPESIREILNNIKLPDCHYCKKPFEENEYAVAVDRANVFFHAQCFRCAGCNQSLADNIYFYHKETDNVYCGRDYAKIKGYPRCTACDELIFTKEYCLAENATFHLKHFCCFQCDTPLAGQDYTLEDEKPYCLPCYETSKAARCSTCENVIKPDEVGCQLNGVHFHAEDRCFRCIVCGVPLMGKKLLLRNEKLYCSHDCFNTVKK